jgi:flagella basal body P-ring formation protein FlgA
LPVVTLQTLAAAGCLPVTGDCILGRDLALADTRLSALPGTAPFGYAPVPGTRRVFTAAELERIARANGVAPGPDAAVFAEVCFEVPLHVPADAEFIESMRRVLPGEASVRLVDAGRSAIPVGRIEFPLSGLEPPAAGGDAAQLWRGFVQFTDSRRIAVWARVAVVVTYPAVVTRKDLAPETPIEATSLQIETRSGPLKREATASRIEDVAGRVVRRPLRSGVEIPVSLLDEPPAIRRGDLVRVEVRSGLAVLRFDAIAETTVRAGEMAELRNPISGKTFRARAEPGSKAVVVIGKSPAL